MILRLWFFCDMDPPPSVKASLNHETKSQKLDLQSIETSLELQMWEMTSGILLAQIMSTVFFCKDKAQCVKVFGLFQQTKQDNL